MTAKKLVDKVLKDHPESPRALHSLARIYRILYNKLRLDTIIIMAINYK